MIKDPIKKTKNSNKIVVSKNIGPIGPGGVDPSAKYAVEQGYGYEIITNPDGNQYGIVTLPSGRRIDSWELYRKTHTTPQNPQPLQRQQYVMGRKEPEGITINKQIRTTNAFTRNSQTRTTPLGQTENYQTPKKQNINFQQTQRRKTNRTIRAI